MDGCMDVEGSGFWLTFPRHNIALQRQCACKVVNLCPMQWCSCFGLLCTLLPERLQTLWCALQC